MANDTQAELPTPATLPLPRAANGHKPSASDQSGEPDMLPSFAGSFADDPFWDEMMEAIQKDRAAMDARYADARDDAPEPPRVRS